MKITEALLAEHTVFHSLFDHLEKTVPKARSLAEIRTLASLLETMLEAHSRTEDELFIAPLEHCFEQIGHRETFHQEHEEIDACLTLVRKAKQSRNAKQSLLAAITCSRKHFDKEERIVFPMAEKLLKSNTLLKLGSDWMEQRNGGKRTR
jgi:hemerythrin-like domain-containing protein